MGIDYCVAIKVVVKIIGTNQDLDLRLSTANSKELRWKWLVYGWERAKGGRNGFVKAGCCVPSQPGLLSMLTWDVPSYAG